jgi:hypothetical protein
VVRGESGPWRGAGDGRVRSVRCGVRASGACRVRVGCAVPRASPSASPSAPLASGVTVVCVSEV